MKAEGGEMLKFIRADSSACSVQQNLKSQGDSPCTQEAGLESDATMIIRLQSLMLSANFA